MSSPKVFSRLALLSTSLSPALSSFCTLLHFNLVKSPVRCNAPTLEFARENLRLRHVLVQSVMIEMGHTRWVEVLEAVEVGSSESLVPNSA
ncbi:hypothetical protein BU25DRAFT_413114 [Macroventuria anomochaeta]|uniref:Uncharacterized protein n=1 Tax=Macroventuria anomochaeta TaxID=301207 RepID=A0ACB6RU60_9PLEO|nr:uncharacterized protein BU25DRAFT_413114 [Macroventuria anomochaeta]KAF2624940.1 hypothetical protein BU25DRAFT_413114 [Macroventuria anomochaeta]